MRRGPCRQSTETAQSQLHFHRKAIEEFWLPGQKAASSSWGKPWSLTNFNSSAMGNDTPCKHPSPMQPCVQSNQWQTPHRGQRKQTPGPPPKRQRHVQEEKGRRRSRLRADSRHGHEAAPHQGKGLSSISSSALALPQKVCCRVRKETRQQTQGGG